MRSVSFLLVALMALGAVSLVPAATSAPLSLTYTFHGDSNAFDEAAPAGHGATFMDLAPPSSSNPRVITSHTDGGLSGQVENPVVFTMKDPLAAPLSLGDGDPATKGPATDSIGVNYCVAQLTQTAFVPRIVVGVYADGVLIGQRLMNDLSLPANAPQCHLGLIPINQDVDDQTPAETDLGLPTDASGNLVVKAGAVLSVSINSNTPFGGASWMFLYDTADYPSAMTLTYTAGAAAPSAAPLLVNVTTPDFVAHANFSQPTNSSTLYHWKNTHEALAFTANATVTAGNVTYVVKDNTNKTISSQVLKANKTTTLDIPTAGQGNWTILVTYAGFKGSLDLSLAAPKAAAQGATGTTSTGTGTSTASASTSGQTGSASTGSASGSQTTGASSSVSTTNSTPGLGLLPVIAAIGAVLAIRRRL